MLAVAVILNKLIQGFSLPMNSSNETEIIPIALKQGFGLLK